MSTLRSALDLAEAGFHILVCEPRGKVPLTPHGSRDATTDSAQIGEWFARWPDANIGVATGVCMQAGGYLVVLDVDIAGDKRGDVSLVEHIRARGPMPYTLEAITGRIGSHYYFVSDEPLPNSAGRVGRGLDVRGVGGYVVAPPSMHENGNRYSWCAPRAPLAKVDGWLLEAMRPARPANDATSTTSLGRWGHDFGSRVARAFSYVDAMPPAISGAGGHDALWRVALAAVRGFDLDAAPAIEVLRYYNSRCTPPWSERELAHKLKQAQAAHVPAGYLERSA